MTFAPMNMTRQSKIKTTIGNMHDSDPDDILQTRRLLREIGLEAGEDDRPVIDKPLDNAIRIFQRELGLKEDGIMKPNGETEQTLNFALSLAKNETAPPIPRRKPDSTIQKP